jgi:BASS family bile acid:Na+ symporter
MNNTDQNLPALLVQIVLAVIMLAVAFELTISDIKQLPKMWKKLLLGYVMQVTFLPAFIFLMLSIINPSINLVLAFLLLAACPGGNLSQLFVIRSNGNIGLSTGLTFFSTLLSPLTVPGIFFLATHGNSEWSQAYKALELPWGNIFKTLITSLFIPLVIGLWMRSRITPGWTKARELIQKSVPWLLFALLSGACWSFRTALSGIDASMIMMVAGISISCFILSFFFNKFLAQDYATSVTIAWEVSIQNSGLGMVLGLVYFSNVPEVSLVCALWGIWQIGMGFLVSGVIGKIFSRNGVICQTQNVG